MSGSILIFDGDCAFCTAAANFARNKITKDITYAPYQSLELSKYGLTISQCSESLKFVTDTNQVYSGHSAVAGLLIQAGSGWQLLGRLIRLPIISLIAAVVYRTVASNRHRLPGGSSSCELEK